MLRRADPLKAQMMLVLSRGATLSILPKAGVVTREVDTSSVAPSFMFMMRCVRPLPYECSPIRGACAFTCNVAASISDVDAVPLFTRTACQQGM